MQGTTFAQLGNFQELQSKSFSSTEISIRCKGQLLRHREISRYCKVNLLRLPEISRRCKVNPLHRLEISNPQKNVPCIELQLLFRFSFAGIHELQLPDPLFSFGKRK
jgi:hypothetical protein